MLKNLKNVIVNDVFYDCIALEKVAKDTGYSQNYIAKLYKQGNKGFLKKPITKGKHGKHKKEKIISSWGAFDTETCYKNLDNENKSFRIWSFQIALHPIYIDNIILTEKILKKENKKFYRNESCLLFSDFETFLYTLNIMYNLGLRTLFVHNLKYDATWLCNYIENKLDVEHNEIKNPHTAFLMHNGKLYSGEIYLGTFTEDNHNYIKVIDSYKTLVGSLGSITNVYHCEHSKIRVPENFYLEYRNENHVFTDLEILYNSYDVIGLCEAIYNFDVEMYNFTEIHALNMTKEYPALKTAAGLAYKVLEQAVKEYACITCSKKEECKYYNNKNCLCQKTGERKNCVRYLHYFNKYFPKFRVQSEKLKNVLRKLYKGKAIFLENPMLENFADELDIMEKHITYNTTSFDTGIDALIAYSFDSYKGAVTMAIPDRAGNIYTGDYGSNIFKDCKYTKNNNFVFKKNFKKQIPTGWVEDYTSLYPSRMRLQMPCTATTRIEGINKVRKQFFENPEKTTRKIYNIDFNITDIKEYIASLNEFLNNENNESIDIKYKPDFYNGFFYIRNTYKINSESFNYKECIDTVTGYRKPLKNKYFIVNANIAFEAPFYFFQILTRYLTEEQIIEWNKSKGKDKKGIGFRQYQKNTKINGKLNKINVKMPLDELMFYKNIVEKNRGKFYLEIIDGIGCDITDENPLAHYINYLGEMKKNAKGVLRNIIKLLLNSAYGKFGTKAVCIEKSLTDMIYCIDKNYYMLQSDETSENYMYLANWVNFVPVATAVTSHGRMHLFAPNVNEYFYNDIFYNIETKKTGGFIQGQMYNLVDYCDTDSMYVINRLGFKTEKEMREFFGMVGDGKELGEFKCEDEIIAFKTLGAKRKQYFTLYKDKYIANHTTIAGLSYTLKFNDFASIKNLKTKKSKIDKNTGITIIYDSPFKMEIKDKQILYNEQIIVKNEIIDGGIIDGY